MTLDLERKYFHSTAIHEAGPVLSWYQLMFLRSESNAALHKIARQAFR
ncbi:hypothetical protein BCIN_04g02820 [Botrytis cinerea B05.10]|uniref:Uncharacterized protein n=1 Tax=Botryotinia fuckeliana (strain B05.10) TaxID=332648 RepID=A0A384JEQ9_BOTFB|nr:hypothetical protein BCIN_04g02820 [Botrytis cinerea B05.10]ATZ49093.1 hypothetical protein BCIN_04g02820 [Botrytis cinerea B05.10]